MFDNPALISIGRGKEEKGTKEEAFKRLFGVNRELGEKMKSILQNEFDELHKQGSSPPKLLYRGQTDDNHILPGIPRYRKFHTASPKTKDIIQRKRRVNTLTTQVIINRQIVNIRQEKGSVRDFKRYKDHIGKVVAGRY